MKKLSGLKTVAAIATFVAATAISTSALANPFNPFEALFGPHREPVAAPAYANPADDGAQRSECAAAAWAAGKASGRCHGEVLRC